MQYTEIWNDVKQQIHKELDQEIYDSFFVDTNDVFKVSKNTIYVIAPNEFVKKRIDMLYLERLNELLNTLVEEYHRFKIISEQEAIEESKTGGYDLTSPEKSHHLKDSNLNQNYSFKSFVVGPSNRLAYTSATKVADQPGVVANPLYIFGDVGLGKTHLMQCIGNYIIENDLNQKVLYIKTDQFVEDYVKSSTKKQFSDFNNKFKDVDVLLIDDIQFLAKKEKSQEEFFKIFEVLQQNQKQIVITSDRPASELKNMMSRLTSRFEWGLSVDINAPDLDHRIQILRKKLISETANPELINEDILLYIASSFDNNVRELEGALKRVMFYCTAFDLPYTKDNAELALESIVKPKKDKLLNTNKIENVLSTVADYFHITISDMASKARTRKYVYPRQIAMYLIKTFYDLPYKKIGTYFKNRDHSTVMHSIEKITNEIQMDVDVKKDVENLTIKCGEI
jgi:chromosomal replication initiator protein